MRYRILLIIILLGRLNAWSADTLQVGLNTSVFKKGDTIEFKCTIPDYAALKLSSATLNVWIEDIYKNKRWKFRYPMINGEVSASLAIGDKIPDGKYAINFLVQRGFFKVTGEILNFDKRDSLINYMMIPRNKKASYFDNTRVAADGSFRLKSTLFEDSAYFIFTPVKKVKNNDLRIMIESPLDSFFVPAASSTRFITVGTVAAANAAAPAVKDTNSYVFDSDEPVDKSLLPGVTVIGKIKKKIEQFNEENSRGLFQRDDAIIFDGLDNEDISRSFSILQFLQGKVAGLSVVKDDTTGYDIAKWRNETVEIYLDEFRMEPGDNLFITPADVAMIKVYRPPAQISTFSGGAGAIAIYTKKGRYATNRARHNFIVRGYTSMDSVWE
jgi:hypothetical protein